MTRFGDALEKFDQLAGASRGSVVACEAAWPAGAPVEWADVYRAAKRRRPRRSDGEALVAFLEGAVVMASLAPSDQWTRADVEEALR